MALASFCVFFHSLTARTVSIRLTGFWKPLNFEKWILQQLCKQTFKVTTEHNYISKSFFEIYDCPISIDFFTLLRQFEYDSPSK